MARVVAANDTRGGGTKASTRPERRGCGLYTTRMISRVYKGSSYIEFKNFLKRSYGGVPHGSGEREQLLSDEQRRWKETLKTLNFCPAHFDLQRRPVPAIVYKNLYNEIFIDILLHNSTGEELYAEEKMLDVTVSKIPYPNCLCDLCLRRLLFQQQRTVNHVKRMILLDGSVYWVQESGVNLQRMLMSVEDKECCVRTEFGFPFWLYPQMRCTYSVCEPELYHLVWLDGLPDGSYIVNPSIVCNSEEAWLAGKVYLVTPNCQKYKVLGGIPSVLRDILLTFKDLPEIWVIVIKNVYVFSICVVYHDGFSYIMEEMYTDEFFFV